MRKAGVPKFLKALPLVCAAACSGQGGREAASEPAIPETKMAPTPPATPASGAAVGDLPFADGQTFASLDQYLTHLRKLGASDIPYYEEVEPGVYQVMAGRAGLQPQRYTREELERRFGFRR